MDLKQFLVEEDMVVEFEAPERYKKAGVEVFKCKILTQKETENIRKMYATTQWAKDSKGKYILDQYGKPCKIEEIDYTGLAIRMVSECLVEPNLLTQEAREQAGVETNDEVPLKVFSRKEFAYIADCVRKINNEEGIEEEEEKEAKN